MKLNSWCDKCDWLTNECHCEIYKKGKCTGPCCNENHSFWKIQEKWVENDSEI